MANPNPELQPVMNYTIFFDAQWGVKKSEFKPQEPSSTFTFLVVGPKASGKTSLLQLMKKFLNPAITIEHINSNKVNQRFQNVMSKIIIVDTPGFKLDESERIIKDAKTYGVEVLGRTCQFKLVILVMKLADLMYNDDSRKWYQLLVALCRFDELAPFVVLTTKDFPEEKLPQTMDEYINLEREAASMLWINRSNVYVLEKSSDISNPKDLEIDQISRLINSVQSKADSLERLQRYSEFSLSNQGRNKTQESIASVMAEVQQASMEFLAMLRRLKLRLFTPEEAKWFLCSEAKVIRWLTEILSDKKEIQHLWNNYFINILVLTKSDICDVFRSHGQGVFMLRPIPSTIGFAVTVILEYEAPDANIGVQIERSSSGKRKFRELREFFISDEEVRNGRLIDLIRRKQWLLTPLKYIGEQCNVKIEQDSKDQVTGMVIAPDKKNSDLIAGKQMMNKVNPYKQNKVVSWFNLDRKDLLTNCQPEKKLKESQ
eukprot:TRINITY_DN13335_c0_g1_i1.p1 TRINITY_DN13335_c0_g1~~TRINITY_DN13335_c0_g1_i1.p1  ORF type:complete len:487 (+),score=72.82 TRINITY_DN13335_c0_g1_i1:15-1475(+)